MNEAERQEKLKKLEEYRTLIDKFDDVFALTLLARTATAKAIGEMKRELNIPVEDPEREKKVIERVTKDKTEEEKQIIIEFYDKIFEISKRVQ